MKGGLIIAAVAALLVVPVAGFAQGAPGAATARARVGGFYVGAGVMTAWGDGGFRISGLDPDVGRFSSVLEFPMDGTYFVLESGIDEIGRGFGVHLRYGTSGSLDGTTVDTDYAWDITSLEYTKSFSSTDGENVFLTLDVSYRLYDGAGEWGGRTRLDLFAGYHMQDATFSVSDVNTVIQNARPVDYHLEGLAATYDMEFYGVRVGVRGEIATGPSGTISGYMAVLPYVAADGFGQWIVRGKALDHDATGWGLDLQVRYEYAVSSSVRLWGGVGYTRMEGSDGTDTQFFFSSEPIGRARLDEIESEYGFVVIGGEFRF